MKPRRLLFLAPCALLLAALVSCETTPKTYLGQRVKATRWANGRMIYILADGRMVYAPVRDKAKEQDQRRTREAAAESHAAAKDIVFDPMALPAPTSDTSETK